MTALDALVDPCPRPAALSTTRTSRPQRASSSATALPMTPAPITTAAVPLTRRSCRGAELHVDLLVPLRPLRLRVAAVGTLVGGREVDVVGERGEQCPWPQPAPYDDIELCRQDEDDRLEVDTRDQAQNQGEQAVYLLRAPQLVRHVVGTGQLQPLPRGGGDDGTQPDVTPAQRMRGQE